MTSHPAFEVTAHQAWWLADHLRLGAYPWKLAITGPYTDPNEADSFETQCREELAAAGIIDANGSVNPLVTETIRTVCQRRQWLEWYTIVDSEQMLRGVLARDPESESQAVVALRHAQMVTFTPLEVLYSEAVVPILTAGLPDRPPARFNEFVIPMDLGAAVDRRVARGADITEALVELGVPEDDAQFMEMARQGPYINVEVTAHEAGGGGRHQSEVSINILSTQLGQILVHPPAGERREGAASVFVPADRFSIAMAVRDLTAQLPSGTWFPDENYDI